jgi:putative FmdB family regulatory protein
MSPLYDYKCTGCGDEFELFHKMDELPSTVCKNCGERAEKIISPPSRDWFRSFVSEDFNGKPILVESKEHYKKLCKEHGVVARCLL